MPCYQAHCHLTKWAIMGVFNFLVIPVSCRIHFRVLVSKFFDNEPIYALLIGGASMILAGIIALTINDETKLQ
jgi:maltose/moltooligosaccharide transporter